jgi:hypothetical protein
MRLPDIWSCRIRICLAGRSSNTICLAVRTSSCLIIPRSLSDVGCCWDSEGPGSISASWSIYNLSGIVWRYCRTTWKISLLTDRRLTRGSNCFLYCLIVIANSWGGKSPERFCVPRSWWEEEFHAVGFLESTSLLRFCDFRKSVRFISAVYAASPRR